jgi:hypothetical protein
VPPPLGAAAVLVLLFPHASEQSVNATTSTAQCAFVQTDRI